MDGNKMDLPCVCACTLHIRCSLCIVGKLCAAIPMLRMDEEETGGFLPLSSTFIRFMAV